MKCYNVKTKILFCENGLEVGYSKTFVRADNEETAKQTVLNFFNKDFFAEVIGVEEWTMRK